MRGKCIDKKWFANDYVNGNRLCIVIKRTKKNYEQDCDKLFEIISSIKPGYLEFVYFIYNRKFEAVVKFKDYIKPHHKAHLRQDLYSWNPKPTNSVTSILSYYDEKVDYMKTFDNIIFKKGPMYKDTEEPVKKNDMKVDFIEFMKKNNLMILENTNIFVNEIYKQVSYDDIIELLYKDKFFDKYKLSSIQKFYKNIETEQGLMSSYYRRDIPIYRPRRRYLEFSDCVYDTFTLKRLSKNSLLLDSDSSTKIVHPCYKFDKTFIYCSQCIPYNYFIQIAKMMEPEQFEWIFNNFTNEFTPSENYTIISYPHKTDIFKPLVHVYDNVLYKVDETNADTFNMSNCLDKEILFTQNINPLESFKKNRLFKNKHVLESITDGKPFETKVKYKESQVCTKKIVISVMDNEILYIPPWLSSKILGIELSKDSVQLDADEFTDEHIGGYIIASMMTNKDEIKQFIKNMRYDNDWNKPIKINGYTWPNIPLTQEIEKPKYEHYGVSVSDYEKYKESNRI